MGDPLAKNVDVIWFWKIDSWGFGTGSKTSSVSLFTALNAINDNIIETDVIAEPITRKVHETTNYFFWMHI